MNDQNKQNKIIWMMDETIAHARPTNWQQIRELETALIDTIGNKELSHELIDPIPCLREMAKQLQHEQFSFILDLTGWLTPAIQELFPATPIENRFALSRVRVVSSPTFETTGYKVNMFPDQIEDVARTMDFSRPLIIDDASFSGWTSRKAMDLFGLDPEATTHAFLIANTGNLGNNPGAVSMLESIGSRVVFGHELRTPQEDGWHLKDLHQNPNLEQAFILALLFQETIRKNGTESELAQQFFGHETVIKTLFPGHLTSKQIRELMQEGRFVLKNGNVMQGDEIHARNPFLWAAPAFQAHVDITRVLANKDEVISILGTLRSLTTDPEGKKEASLELKREIQNLRKSHSPENQFSRGKEQL